MTAAAIAGQAVVTSSASVIDAVVWLSVECTETVLVVTGCNW